MKVQAEVSNLNFMVPLQMHSLLLVLAFEVQPPYLPKESRLALCLALEFGHDSCVIKPIASLCYFGPH